ncbi:MAG: hypothetical protein ACOYKE_14345 [Ferruginibacter sp.]
MNKFNFLITILLLFIIIKSPAQDKLPDLKAEGLKGKVKSVKTKSYDAKEQSGTFVKSNLDVGEGRYVYNQKGKMVEKSYYRADGSLYSIEIYKYNDNGCLSEYKKVENNEIKENYTCKCDEKSNVIEKIESVDLIGTTTIKYNDKGNVIEEFTDFHDGSPFRVTYKYDEKGNNIENNMNNDIITTNKYDLTGNRIESSNRYGYSIYKYDAKGNQIETSSYKNGALVYKCKDKYDATGNIIESVCYNSDGSLRSGTTFHKFVYDNFNNWIKKTSYTETSSFGVKGISNPQIEERKIEYYL